MVVTGLEDHLIPVFLPWAGSPLTRPSYSKPEVFLEALFVQDVAPFYCIERALGKVDVSDRGAASTFKKLP